MSGFRQMTANTDEAATVTVDQALRQSRALGRADHLDQSAHRGRDMTMTDIKLQPLEESDQSSSTRTN
jgi:hypothetical protein